ncbi:MAG: hypothetical protein A4S09_01085 [Proteobacteria bacterium SG_bin7]|nr:MAG: hypothetical protein A4S09_01085 [Proteobacteria bacterium SG_bin7]
MKVILTISSLVLFCSAAKFFKQRLFERLMEYYLLTKSTEIFMALNKLRQKLILIGVTFMVSLSFQYTLAEGERGSGGDGSGGGDAEATEFAEAGVRLANWLGLNDQYRETINVEKLKAMSLSILTRLNTKGEPAPIEFTFDILRDSNGDEKAGITIFKNRKFSKIRINRLVWSSYENNRRKKVELVALEYLKATEHDENNRYSLATQLSENFEAILKMSIEPPVHFSHPRFAESGYFGHLIMACGLNKTYDGVDFCHSAIKDNFSDVFCKSRGYDGQVGYTLNLAIAESEPHTPISAITTHETKNTRMTYYQVLIEGNNSQDPEWPVFSSITCNGKKLVQKIPYLPEGWQRMRTGNPLN